MPSQSKAQFRYIQALRSKYGSEADTPEEHKWIWEGDWTHGVNYKKLPETTKSGAILGLLKSATTASDPAMVARLLKREGGPTKVIKDSGGTTKGGIAETSGHFTKEQIKNLTPQQINAYWQQQLQRQKNVSNPGTREILFDMEANMGPRAWQVAREQANALLPKGQAALQTAAVPFSQNTASAINALPQEAYAQRLMDAYKRHHEGLAAKNPAKYQKYAKGWANRRQALWNSPSVVPIHQVTAKPVVVRPRNTNVTVLPPQAPAATPPPAQPVLVRGKLPPSAVVLPTAPPDAPQQPAANPVPSSGGPIPSIPMLSAPAAGLRKQAVLGFSKLTGHTGPIKALLRQLRADGAVISRVRPSAAEAILPHTAHLPPGVSQYSRGSWDPAAKSFRNTTIRVGKGMPRLNMEMQPVGDKFTFKYNPGTPGGTNPSPIASLFHEGGHHLHHRAMRNSGVGDMMGEHAVPGLPHLNSVFNELGANNSALQFMTQAGADPQAIAFYKGVRYPSFETYKHGLPESTNSIQQRILSEGKFGFTPGYTGLPDYYKSASVSAQLRRAINATHTHPTPAQTSAGNYRKGEFEFRPGMRIKIENPDGSTRRGYKDGKEIWSRVMNGSYGYFKGTKAADGDAVDCFVGPHLDSDVVVAIDQYKGKTFDETKFVLGTKSEKEGVALYLSNYPKGWKLGPVTTLTVKQLQNWLKDGEHAKPFEGQQEKSAAAIKSMLSRALTAKSIAKMVSPKAMGRRSFLADVARKTSSTATENRPVAGAFAKAMSAAGRTNPAEAMNDLSAAHTRLTTPVARPNLVMAGNPKADTIFTDAGEAAARRMVAPKPQAPAPSAATLGMFAGSYNRRDLLKRLLLSTADPGVIPAAGTTASGLLSGASNVASLLS